MKRRFNAVTLQEIEAIPREMLRSSDIAGYLNSNPQDIRTQAQKDPQKLGFPVVVIGSRVKIPKQAFIAFIKGGQAK